MTILMIAIMSVVLSVTAQFLLKAGLANEQTQAAVLRLPEPAALWILATNVSIFCGFLLYGLGAVVWLKVLAQWDVSKAYPMVGLGFCLSLLVGWYMGEAVATVRIVGVVLICAGVAVISHT